MTVFTVGKNGRVYPRKFDWDEARARHAAGETYSDIAKAYGVTKIAVARVCDTAFKERFDARRRAFTMSGVCEDCGKTGITSAAHRRATTSGWDGRVLCQTCERVAARTRFRFDENGVLIQVCCGRVACAHGERWQPPENFPGADRYRDLRPKGIHSACRDCNTMLRREHRRRNREASNAYDRARRARRKNNREAAA